MMNYLKQLTIILFFSLFFVSSVFADDADDNTGRDDTQFYNIYDSVYLVSTMKISYAKPRIVVKSVYPQIENNTGKDGIDIFNQLATDIVQQAIAEFKLRVAKNHGLQANLPKTAIKNNLYIDYDSSVIKSAKDHIISIRFSMQGYIAGKDHPYHQYTVLNFDLDTGQKIELSDLFFLDANYLDALSIYTRGILFKRLANKLNIGAGTLPTTENFTNWNIKPNGLLITFNESQVAPATNGAQTVLIPYSALKKIIAPDSLINGCVKNPSTCARSNVLTGGFIDEAMNKTSHENFSVS